MKAEPQLNIFGAARRVLGNGRVVTLSQDGRASLQPQSAEFQQRPAANVKKAPAARPRQQEPYVRAPPSRPATAVGAHKSLLARLGIVKAAVPPRSTTSPASVAADVQGQAGTPTGAPISTAEKPTPESLRAKLQARLTAEYRQALATRANGTGPLDSSPATAVKTDLRSLLQSRLQAEKALAYEDLVRSKAAASLSEARGGLNATAEPFASRASRATNRGGGDEPTIFSQATRDLLMARLEEERLIADDEEYDTGFYLPDYAYDLSFDSAVGFDTGEADSPQHGDDVPAEPTPPSTPAKSESSLKAALLAKRQASLEDELKKRTGELKEKMMRQRLMQKRKSTGGQAQPQDAGASAS